MNMQDKAYYLHSYLPKGRKNAVTIESLKRSTGFSRRVITDCMQYLRKEGIPVCSCNSQPGGYFIANNQDEIMDYLERLIEIDSGITKTISIMTGLLLKKVGDDGAWE